MGNNINIKNNKFNDFFTVIDENNISYLRNNYKIIDVDYLHPSLVHSKIFADDYFSLLSNKKEMVNNMLDFYLNHSDRAIFFLLLKSAFEM